MRMIVWIAVAIAAATADAQPALKPSSIDTSVNHAAALAVADLNRDGRPDLAAASWGNPPSSADSRGLRYALALDDRARSWHCLAVDPSYQPMGADAADIDNDDTIDVVACSWNSNDVAWWRNDGADPIVWTRHDITTGFINAHEVHAVDIDGDGKADIAAASAGLNQIKIWYNQGGSPPSWYPQVVDSSFGGARSVAAADFDGDGDIDLAGAALADNEVSWWRNDGGWPITWTYQAIDVAFPMAHRLNCCDVDRDGRIDLVGAGYSQGVAWWRNEPGAPVNWNKQDIEIGYSGAMVAHAADMDGDGDIDVIGTNQPANEVCVWENLGGAPPGWQKHARAFPGPWPIIPWDMDSDGDPDIITGGYEEAIQMINLTPLQLTAQPTFQTLAPGDSVVMSLNLPLRYGQACHIRFSALPAIQPQNGTITIFSERDSLISPDSCLMTIAASADVSPGLYPIILISSDGRDTLADSSQISIEIAGLGEAAVVCGGPGMLELARGVWGTVDSLWSVPASIGGNYQGLVVEGGGGPGDTAKLRSYIEGGGRVLLTGSAPVGLCQSSNLAGISGWVGATGYAQYSGGGIKIISTREGPFGVAGIGAGDTLGTAVAGFGRLSGLTGSGVQVARLGTINTALAGVYCGSGSGHCFYYTGGAGISPESDSLLSGFLRNPVLGVEGNGPETHGPRVDQARIRISPNPGRGRFEIRCLVPQAGPVRLAVYNVAGQQVAEVVRGERGTGEFTACWDGRDGEGRPVSAGAYLVSLKTSAGGAVIRTFVVR